MEQCRRSCFRCKCLVKPRQCWPIGFHDAVLDQGVVPLEGFDGVDHGEVGVFVEAVVGRFHMAECRESFLGVEGILGTHAVGFADRVFQFERLGHARIAWPRGGHEDGRGGSVGRRRGGIADA
ncbi:MAG: hypothetical protein CMM61_08650 [Rhodospirillaceae bacterium]|nr:hypothetical protein [Rhodospirillaceae bacterium]